MGPEFTIPEERDPRALAGWETNFFFYLLGFIVSKTLEDTVMIRNVKLLLSLLSNYINHGI